MLSVDGLDLELLEIQRKSCFLLEVMVEAYCIYCILIVCIMWSWEKRYKFARAFISNHNEILNSVFIGINSTQFIKIQLHSC